MKPKESDIQRSILDYLKLRRVWHRRLNSGAAMLPGKGGKPRPVFFGAKGMPDILARTTAGSIVWIEVKSATGRQTPEQKLWQQDMERFGDTYIVARSVDAVMALFEQPPDAA